MGSGEIAEQGATAETAEEVRSREDEVDGSVTIGSEFWNCSSFSKFIRITSFMILYLEDYCIHSIIHEESQQTRFLVNYYSSFLLSKYDL